MKINGIIMNELDYKALRQQVSKLSHEIETLKAEISKLKGEDTTQQQHRYTKEEVDAFRKSRTELIESYHKFLQAMRKGMDADLIIKYKKQYLSEIEKRFTGPYIDSTKSRFLAEFEFAYNSSPRIIVVDNYTIPIDGNTMDARTLITTLKSQRNDITDDEIRSVADHYYSRIHTDNIPAMMAMLDKALDINSLNESLDTNINTLPWDDDNTMVVK